MIRCKEPRTTNERILELINRYPEMDRGAIAERVGVSRAHVGNIIRRAARKLALNASGPERQRR